MRGGAIPLLAWGTLLLVLAIGNWIWNAKTVNGLAATFAVVAIYLSALLLFLRGGRRAVQRGEPDPDERPTAIPQASSGAALFGLAVASILFGFTFGSFLVYFGAGLLVIAIGRLALERRDERRSLERWRPEE
jgi:Na+/H+-translocating membrane pyrophosphatase